MQQTDILTRGTNSTALFRGSIPRTVHASGFAAKLAGAVLGTDSGGYGFTGTMHWFTETMHFPWIFGFAAIMAETIGGIALLIGFASRFAALGVGAVFATAIATVHAQHGFFMNWFGNQKGEGWEYFLPGLALVAIITIHGGGAASVDRLLGRRSNG